MNNVFIVFQNADTTEGRGPMLISKVFSKKEVADKYALSIEPYKNANQFTEVKEYKVLDSYCPMLDRYQELLQTPQVQEFIKLQKKM